MMIRIATMADLTPLLQIRRRFFSDSREAISAAEIEAIDNANRLFFEAHLNSPVSRTWVAESDDDVVAVGTLAFFVRPASSGQIPAVEAYLLNVYTLPEYRRRGFAGAIVDAAKSYAHSQGLQRIWLHATESGRTLYESAGFQSAATCKDLKSA